MDAAEEKKIAGMIDARADATDKKIEELKNWLSGKVMPSTADKDGGVGLGTVLRMIVTRLDQLIKKVDA